MTYRLAPFASTGLTQSLLELLLDEHERATLPKLKRFWDYYRNPARAARTPGERPRLAQEVGLPQRVLGRDEARPRREVVVENDIAWRVQSMVDFMFGKPVRIVSTARDAATRAAVERTLDAVWEASGGIALLQDMALLGHIHGHVDLVVRAAANQGVAAGPGGRGVSNGSGRETQALPPASSPAFAAGSSADPAEIAPAFVRVEIVEAARGVPVLDPADYRRLRAYVIHTRRDLLDVESPSAWRPFGPLSRRRRAPWTEVISATHRQVYDDGKLILDEPLGAWTNGQPPVAHIQNISQPFHYDGLGEVEPLIPHQDELNTRLSDRACRVTLQSFKMYLVKGLDGLDRRPVTPGTIWSTDNPDASVTAFGGDADSPSERDHILEIREAMDKTSGVPPLASGVVRAKIGNLSSANALRITLMGVLAKTARKRVTYGQGIARASGLILAALDELGVLPTDPRDRGIRLVWPDPLPEDLGEQAALARAKADLGVPVERVLAGLGEDTADQGIA
ncbi:MAG: phage portal protein [Phycisphaerales bacterium]